MLRVSRRAAGVRDTGLGEDCGWGPAPGIKVGVLCYGLVVSVGDVVGDGK